MRTAYDISEELKNIFAYTWIEGWELSEEEKQEMYEDFRQDAQWLLEEWEKS